MSDEKRREELKAIINEQLDKLSIEELENVSGGYRFIVNDHGAYYIFTKEETDLIEEKLGIHLRPKELYGYKYINEIFPVNDKTGFGDVMALLGKLGLKKYTG